MKKFRFIIYALIFAACLITGFQMGARIETDALVKNDLPPTISPEVEVPNNGQKNLLIIGADQIEGDGADLQSIWLVLYFPNSPRMTLVPIFPALPGIATNRNEDLASAFGIGSDGIPEAAFWDVLKELKFWWSGYILMDQIAAGDILDLLGEENPGQGSHGIRDLYSWSQDPKMAMQGQADMLQSLCTSFPQTSPSKDLKPIFDLMPDHIRTNIDRNQIIDDWLNLTAHGSNLSCEFPTLTTFGY